MVSRWFDGNLITARPISVTLLVAKNEVQSRREHGAYLGNKSLILLACLSELALTLTLLKFELLLRLLHIFFICCVSGLLLNGHTLARLLQKRLLLRSLFFLLLK